MAFERIKMNLGEDVPSIRCAKRVFGLLWQAQSLPKERLWSNWAPFPLFSAIFLLFFYFKVYFCILVSLLP